MFFVLSKIIYWLIMPVSLITWVAIASILVKGNRLKLRLRILGMSLFLFFTNPFLATLAINSWEPEAIPYDQLRKHYKYGIVLSGITNPNRKPFDRVQFNKGADRIVHAMDLYKKGIIEKILITGGSGVLTFDGKKESHKLKDFVLQNGVPARDVLVEDQARNTYENARYSYEIIHQPPGDVLMISSAFHVYRAKKCFDKVGLETTPFPTDHYGRELTFTPDEVFIPSIYGLKIWTILTKEWLGIIAYKIRGYI